MSNDSQATLHTTILRSGAKEVQVNPLLPTVVIGERCNALGYRSIREAANRGDFGFIADMAKKQVDAGVDMVNVNMVGLDVPEIEALPQAVKAILAAVDVPISVDFGDPKALDVALSLIPGKPLINSINGETSKLEAVLPIMKKHGAAAIALVCMDEGIPYTAQGRLKAAHHIVNTAAQIGIPASEFIFDCICLGVATDETAGPVTFETMHLVRQELGANILLGASNASHGLPRRSTLNAAYVAAAITHGMNCVLSDLTLPALKWSILSADAVAGRDPFGVRYIQAHRTEEEAQACQSA